MVNFFSQNNVSSVFFILSVAETQLELKPNNSETPYEIGLLKMRMNWEHQLSPTYCGPW